MSHPPAHRKERDERGTTQYLVIRFLAAFDRATCPYNTRSAFERYDDNLEHAQWLGMMYPRLEMLRDLMREDGSIWVTIDDNLPKSPILDSAQACSLARHATRNERGGNFQRSHRSATTRMAHTL